MREVFRNELDELATQLVDMSTKVLDSIRLANQAVQNNDLDLAERVIEADADIDAMQHTLDQQAAEILALQAPVAADLRAVIGALRMSASLERMGDLARHIAQQVRIRYPESAIPQHFSGTFARMGDAAEKIAEATVNLLSNPGLSMVPTINAIDEELDELHLSVFAKLADAPAEDLAPRHIADVTLLSRYYERFGDHAVSVSQKVEYLLTGNWEPYLSRK
ncbi:MULTISPECIES: phosphate signaling complex protein PhoU [Brevibacterium]|uniref:Phosphate-specific transport system accessory protein PhoU n=5 Tax=Bacteria TaxID=2 RepID=K9AE60_9MICO|nr:phosphate signaling complex protein PhoU [Brevibacterium casei]NJE67344.1 phosphate signaling complex protein PhoU [Brevibacterium sp. LS14]SII05106.1 phosphate transport system regulatory protein PhoU [Mycobacteroides abscessus subsp. abscessus]EKU45553.1 phosphate transport system regulator [Brevibacterium casei S18]KZE19607.1 PhoU family transcriptional regulator [Brevibacterium casei]MBE4696095.1 phosphate signaling complex protein PhoU [Brevibacterium casei]